MQDTKGTARPSEFSATADCARFLRRSRQDFVPAGPAIPMIEGLRRVQGRRLAMPEILSAHRTGRERAAIDDITTIPPPNLRVVFVLQEMAHAVVSGGGVPQSFMSWEGDSPVATEEVSGPFSLPAPGPGETWPIDYANAIYQAFATGGCDSATLAFPVRLRSAILEGEEGAFGLVPGPEIGLVEPSDEDTINAAGIYSFFYTIRASGSAGGVSDFTARGVVTVGCTTDGDLD